MGADLDEQAHAVGEHRLDGLGEAHGLADVAPPVASVVRRSADQRSADRRVDRRGGRLRTQVIQGRQQRILQGVHLWA